MEKSSVVGANIIEKDKKILLMQETLERVKGKKSKGKMESSRREVRCGRGYNYLCQKGGRGRNRT